GSKSRSEVGLLHHLGVLSFRSRQSAQSGNAAPRGRCGNGRACARVGDGTLIRSHAIRHRQGVRYARRTPGRSVADRRRGHLRGAHIQQLISLAARHKMPTMYDFAPSSSAKKVMPVTLPPGWRTLLTSPIFTGSAPVTNTTGMVVVAFLAAKLDGGPPAAAITRTLRRTRSAASSGTRSMLTFAERKQLSFKRRAGRS